MTKSFNATLNPFFLTCIMMAMAHDGPEYITQPFMQLDMTNDPVLANGIWKEVVCSTSILWPYRAEALHLISFLLTTVLA